MDINKLSSTIIGAAVEVHKALGPGLLESAYEECLCHELALRNLSFERQKALPVAFLLSAVPAPLNAVPYLTGVSGKQKIKDLGALCVFAVSRKRKENEVGYSC